MGLDHPWTEPPRPGTVVDVLPGIKWLRMPLPFRLDHINLWLLEDGAGWTAVDTGIGLEETRALWERVFAETLDGLAHLRFLEDAGRVVRQVGDDGVHRFLKA